MTRDEHWMRLAISEARDAAAAGEVPVGAVIVRGEKMIAKGRNRREEKKDPLSHAEMEAIAAASEQLHDWRLTDCELFVTLEPCLMCTGAISESKIRRVVFGAFDIDKGAVISCLDLHLSPFGRGLEWIGGIFQEECESLLRDFFKKRRKETL